MTFTQTSRHYTARFVHTQIHDLILAASTTVNKYDLREYLLDISTKNSVLNNWNIFSHHYSRINVYWIFLLLKNAPAGGNDTRQRQNTGIKFIRCFEEIRSTKYTTPFPPLFTWHYQGYQYWRIILIHNLIIYQIL